MSIYIPTNMQEWENFIKSNLKKYNDNNDGKEIKNSNDNNVINTPVKSVQQYLRIVEQIYKNIQNNSTPGVSKQFKNLLWYRGLASLDYDLKPSISRGGLNSDYEVIYLSKFKSMAIPYVEKLPGYLLNEGTPSYWGWLFLMQHYGLPTRLLDWSTNALVGLLFATHDRNAEQRKFDAVVWLLNPVKWNSTFQLYDFLPTGYIPNVAENVVYEQFEPESVSTDKKPLAAIGPLNSTRIVAQQGTFTIYPHTKDLISMDRLPGASESMYKILIDNNSTDSIVKELTSYGITYASLFPEIASIAQQIKEEGIFKA